MMVGIFCSFSPNKRIVNVANVIIFTKLLATISRLEFPSGLLESGQSLSKIHASSVKDDVKKCHGGTGVVCSLLGRLGKLKPKD